VLERLDGMEFEGEDAENRARRLSTREDISPVEMENTGGGFLSEREEAGFVDPELWRQDAEAHRRSLDQPVEDPEAQDEYDTGGGFFTEPDQPETYDTRGGFFAEEEEEEPKPQSRQTILVMEERPKVIESTPASPMLVEAMDNEILDVPVEDPVHVPSIKASPLIGSQKSNTVVPTEIVKVLDVSDADTYNSEEENEGLDFLL